MPNTLERIGKSAFENCFAFKGIELKDGLRTIEDYAFANCRSIKKINLPKTINDFGSSVFIGCISLDEVIGSENIKWQRKTCFNGTQWLASKAINGFVFFDNYLEAYIGTDDLVEIPDGIKIIGRSAFDGNSYVSNIKISEGVEIIEDFAFANCKNLKNIFIPNSVMQIEDNAFFGSSNFMIQCLRGSVASAFKIKNKLPGEYVTKEKPQIKDETVIKKTKNIDIGEVTELSEEELNMIMEMRKKKLINRTKEEKPTIRAITEYSLVQFDSSKVSIKLISEGRKITNNIFTLIFEQNEGADIKDPTEYDTFVIDEYGQIISNIKTIYANKKGDDLVHKVTYSLLAQEKFNKTSKYYVVLRYKNAGLNILNKIQYQISIDFASDFDF